MRIVIDLLNRYSFTFAITFVKTEWYLPIGFWFYRFITSGEITVSILWMVHFSIRFPINKINKSYAENFLPKI